MRRQADRGRRALGVGVGHRSDTASASTVAVGDVAAGACTYSPAQGEAAKDVGTPTYQAAAAKKPFTATLKTNQGDVVVKMATAKAPCTTNSFRFLASKKYYDGTLVPPAHDGEPVRPPVR